MIKYGAVSIAVIADAAKYSFNYPRKKIINQQPIIVMSFFIMITYLFTREINQNHYTIFL